MTDPTPTESDSEQPTGAAGLRAWSKQQGTAGQAKATKFLDDHRDQFAFDIAGRIYTRDKEAAGSIISSALAFRLFLFFVPLLLFIVGLAGFLSAWVSADDVNEAGGVTGGIANQIRSALAQSDRTRWVAVALGLFGIATTGRTLSKVLVSTSCLAWGLKLTSKAPIRVVGAIVGVIAGMGVVSMIINRIRDDLGIGVASISFVGALAVYGIAWIIVSLMLPRATPDPGALLPGAALVAVTLVGMQAVSQLYLPDRLSHASQLYGAIGTTIVTLGWFFIFGRAVVVGMVLNAVLYERFGSISHVVLGIPIVRVLPRKSAWIRKFFDLEHVGENTPES